MQKDDFQTKTCRTCGKQFEVLHPSRWAYKKGNSCTGYIYYCSWGCLRKEEREKEMGQAKMTAMELHKKAMEFCIEGGDPLVFLKANGSEEPAKLWWYIRNKFKKTGHDLYSQLPEEQKINSEKKGGRPKRKPEKKPAEEKREAVMTVLQKEEPKKPGLKVTALESREVESGEWRREHDGIELYKDNGPLSSGVHLKLTAEGWMRLCDEINTMLDQFEMKEA